MVRDTVLTVSDVLDQHSVDVDVLDNVFWADGDVRDLGVSLVEGYGTSAQMLRQQADPGDDRSTQPDHPVLGVAPG